MREQRHRRVFLAGKPPRSIYANYSFESHLPLVSLLREAAGMIRIRKKEMRLRVFQDEGRLKRHE